MLFGFGDDGKGGGGDDSNKRRGATEIVEPSDHGGEDGEGTALASLSGIPSYPQVVIVPVERRPLFPGLSLPIAVSNPLLQGIQASQAAGQPYVGVFMRRDEFITDAAGKRDAQDAQDAEDGPVNLVTDLEELHPIGTFAQIHNVSVFPDGSGGQVLLSGHRRIQLNEAVGDSNNVLHAKVTHLTDEPFDSESDSVRAYCNEIVRVLREVMAANPLLREHLSAVAQRIDVHDARKLADFSASVTTANGVELQQVLSELNVEDRLSHVLLLLSKELELTKLQQHISKQVEEKMTENQRKYFLTEQLKSIKKELGVEKDDKEALVNKFRARVEACGELPEEARETVEEELEKLSVLEKNSSEFNVTRNYLDWLTSLPWSKVSEENFDIARASAILDDDHYGMEDVKDTILQLIAVGKLRGSVQGKILLLVGPPGVGKTSIGASIASALNCEFYRFSVGGLTDVAEIKGHRRTYVGAMPGKPVQCLKRTQTSNPLVLIDEIDKLGRGHQGDPASALLELLDPSQNKTFSDHYMDIPLDMSKALFVCTANVLETIPGPLIDRMEVVRLSGYDAPEKIAIAEQFLVPKAIEEAGLAADNELVPPSLSITTGAVEVLTKEYCREAGVRNLQQHIEKMCRKLALQTVRSHEGGSQGGPTSWAVTPDNLDEYVGKPAFNADRLYDYVVPGVVMGLAWTAMGGAGLFIETAVVKKYDEGSGGGGLTTTGQLGDVMGESVVNAQTVARQKLINFDPMSTFFDTHDVHLHVPNGAVKKDGPSAGITMTTALLSLALNRSTRNDVSMTGEVSLTGKVLPVGGIKEKTIAARRAGIGCLILPFANKRDFDELPEYLREGLEMHFAKDYDEVFDIAFCEDMAFE